MHSVRLVQMGAVLVMNCQDLVEEDRTAGQNLAVADVHAAVFPVFL